MGTQSFKGCTDCTWSSSCSISYNLVSVCYFWQTFRLETFGVSGIHDCLFCLATPDKWDNSDSKLKYSTCQTIATYNKSIYRKLFRTYWPYSKYVYFQIPHARLLTVNETHVVNQRWNDVRMLTENTPGWSVLIASCINWCRRH